MSDDRWSAVDAYFDSLFPPDPVLDRVLESAEGAGLPAIHVSSGLGRHLAVLMHGLHARTVLEIGTLAGYSAIWLAGALPADGRLITLEADPAHARIARQNLAAAGLTSRTEVVEGPALETLPAVCDRQPDGFDLIFIDADKEAYPDYWSWALRASHPGTMIIADNVVREGRVADPEDDDARVVGVRRYLALAAAEPRVTTSVLQTVGAKGYDGIAISVVLPEASAGT